jgi:hypothetical protein
MKVRRSIVSRRTSWWTWRGELDLFLAIAAMGFLYPTAATAQVSTPVDLPDGPAKPGFDITRFHGAGSGWFKTFYVAKYESLQQVLTARRVAEDTRGLVTDTATGKLALLTDQMAFHHIAQGHAGGKDWMVTF